MNRVLALRLRQERQGVHQVDQRRQHAVGDQGGEDSDEDFGIHVSILSGSQDRHLADPFNATAASSAAWVLLGFSVSVRSRVRLGPQLAKPGQAQRKNLVRRQVAPGSALLGPTELIQGILCPAFDLRQVVSVGR
mgnify:CR=1 FL=1